MEDAELLARWMRLRSELPNIPLNQDGDQSVLLPAEKVMGQINNMENPELYAIFPYQQYTIGTEGLEVGRRTFATRREKRSGGWFQDPIKAAYLGLSDEALRDIGVNFSATCKDCRFQAFWGPWYDWVPDQDNGAVAMTALQSMLVQSREGQIYVLPAWPQAKDIAFKLHVDSMTTVEAEYRGGKVVKCVVEPAARVVDLVILTK